MLSHPSSCLAQASCSMYDEFQVADAKAQSPVSTLLIACLSPHCPPQKLCTGNCMVDPLHVDPSLLTQQQHEGHHGCAMHVAAPLQQPCHCSVMI